MRTLYLVFAHNRPEQLVRLTSAISQLSPAAVIAVHYDPSNGRLNPDAFSGIPVHIIPQPIHGEWGDYSLVEQYLHAMKWCMQHLEWDWVCTLTGLSYPINALDTFERTLYSSGFDACIRYFDALSPPAGVWPQNMGQLRLLYKYYKLPRFPYYYKVPQPIKRLLGNMRELFNTMQPLIKIIPMPRRARTRVGIRYLRLPLPQYHLYAGRQMFNVNRKAAERMLQFLSQNESYVSYFRRTLIPDESFFITLLMNDTNLRVQNNVWRYIKWPRDNLGSGAVITEEELVEAMRSGAPFGLKFDAEQHPDLLNRIDKILGIVHEPRVCKGTVSRFTACSPGPIKR